MLKETNSYSTGRASRKAHLIQERFFFDNKQVFMIHPSQTQTSHQHGHYQNCPILFM